MHFRWILTTLLLMGATACVTSYALSQEPGKPQSPEEVEFMKKWAEFMTPGEAHKVLKPMAGNWESTIKMWMDSNSPPAESKSTSETKEIMGGRYYTDTVTGEWMGERFDGMGITGYDNMKKKYCSVWIDSAGTGIMYSEGDYDPKTKTLTLVGETPHIPSGKYLPSRMVTHFTDADHYTMEMFGPDMAGKEYKVMEMHTSRVKAK